MSDVTNEDLMILQNFISEKLGFSGGVVTLAAEGETVTVQVPS
jgi:hypothetical protein